MPLPRPKQLRVSRPRRSKASEWVRLGKKIEALEGDWRYGEVVDLDGWKTIKYKETPHDIVVMAELTTGFDTPCQCPPSESQLHKSGFTDPYYLLDIPARNKRFRICYRLQRWYCKPCKTSAQQTVPAVDAKHEMTSRLVEYVEQESFDLFRSFSGVADEVGCSEQTIRNIFTRRAKQLEGEELARRKGGIYEPPVWIAIDEVHPHKGAEYCVISAPALHKVIDILPVNSEKELFRWMVRLRPNEDRIKLVTMDMCLEYRRLVRRLLPRARIVVDRYHVHNLLNVSLKKVLDVIRLSMTYTEHREQMRPEHLLLTSYRRLVAEAEKEKKKEAEEVEDENKKKRLTAIAQLKLLDRWLADAPDIARAHRLKEDFSDILQLTNRGTAEELTNEWLRRVHDFAQYFRAKYERTHPAPWPDPFGNVPGTITEWRDSILNYIDCKSIFNSKTVSNSFAEIANDRIKGAYHVGHHYSYEVLRIKCVYGGVMVRRRPPHPMDGPRLRAVRGRPRSKGKGKKTNPNANLEVLRRARIEADDTRGLLPRPEEHPGFASRFTEERMKGTPQAAVDPEPASQTPLGFVDQEEAQPRLANSGPKRRSNYDPDQQSLF